MVKSTNTMCEAVCEDSVYTQYASYKLKDTLTTQMTLTATCNYTVC